MNFATATSRAAASDLANRRLVGGLLLSLVFHAMLLMLQFGVPGLGLPIAVQAAADQHHAGAAPSRRRPPSPRRRLERRRRAARAGAVGDAAGRTRRRRAAAPVVAKAKPVKPRRISRPLPPREPVESPRR